jgi:hypothetical protein
MEKILIALLLYGMQTEKILKKQIKNSIKNAIKNAIKRSKK